jgi:hypothetical protein
MKINNLKIYNIVDLPIGLYLSANESTAQLGPKKLIADFT